jgi:hypothetical protein
MDWYLRYKIAIFGSFMNTNTLLKAVAGSSILWAISTAAFAASQYQPDGGRSQVSSATLGLMGCLCLGL